MPRREGSLLVVRVLGGGSVIAQSAIADLRVHAEESAGDWCGELYVPLDAFKMSESGELDMELADGERYRFVIVASPTGNHVAIRGFGSPPFQVV